ncbi:MAG: NAD(P)-dependent oxidoreductase [Bacteroidota bacterium]
MRVFITGGSGFVGQNVIPVLKGKGYAVVGLARSAEAASKLEKVGAVPIMDDLTNLSQVTADALRHCDFVVHSAARMELDYNKEKFFEINVGATKKLLSLSKKNGVKKFIYISAAPVIPGSPVINAKESDVGIGLPKALYPRTKAIAEKWVLSSNTKDFQTISLRPPLIWGPNNHHVHEIMDRVNSGKWMWIGGGRQILSTVHIRNLAEAILLALETKESGKPYFITDGDRRPMRETFEKLFEVYGLDAGKKEFPLSVANFMARVFHTVWTVLGLKSQPPVPPLAIRLMAREFSVSDAKARQELGYQNVLSFEEGLMDLKTRLKIEK